jgi:hypothetical protein
VLTEAFRGFSQSLQANAGVAPRLEQDRFNLNIFQVMNIRVSYSHAALQVKLSLCVTN